MFSVLRLAPALGRLLQRSNLEPDNNHVVVLSHAMWQTRYGLVGAFGVTRLLTSMLVGVDPTDGVTFIVVPAFLAAVALVACYVPANRATHVEASVTLREE